MELPVYEKKTASEETPKEPAKRKEPEGEVRVTEKKAKKIKLPEEEYLPMPKITDETPRLDKRTSKESKFIYMFPPTETDINGYALKGPYHSSVIKRIKTLCKIFDMIDIQTRLKIRILFPFGYCKNEEGQIYIKFPLLAEKPGPWPTVTETDRDEKPFPMITQETLGIVPYSKYIKDHEADFLEKDFPSIYAALMWFAVLQIGDRSLDNILVHQGRLWFLDFDEQRKEDPLPTNPVSHNFGISKTMLKKVDNLFEAGYAKHATQAEGLIRKEAENILVHFGVAAEEEIGEEQFQKANTDFTKLFDVAKMDRLKACATLNTIFGMTEF